MQIKVRGGAVKMPCDQWCEVGATFGPRITVRSLGTGMVFEIDPGDVVGARLTDGLSLRFTTHGFTWRDGAPGGLQVESRHQI